MYATTRGAKPEMGGTDSKCVCRAPLASTLATALCKIHALLCWKIADVHGIEVYDFSYENLLIFGPFSNYYCITP